MSTNLIRCLPLLLLALLLGPLAQADPLRVAVASNFSQAMQAIAQRFEADSGHEITLIFGSTGKHYAQIHHGAPFDLFLAADRARPERLEAEGRAIPGSRFTYAIGQLVLWSPRPGYVDERGEVLSTGDFRHLAMANPRLAPYGRAAQQVLRQRKQWGELRPRLVRGENIGQTYQFVQSGNAELGFVALAQIRRPGQAAPGSLWRVPQALYDPIEQQAVQLSDHPLAADFLDYLRLERTRQLINDYGYRLP